jgi:hypothetical protein
MHVSSLGSMVHPKYTTPGALEASTLLCHRGAIILLRPQTARRGPTDLSVNGIRGYDNINVRLERTNCLLEFCRRFPKTGTIIY